MHIISSLSIIRIVVGFVAEVSTEGNSHELSNDNGA